MNSGVVILALLLIGCTANESSPVDSGRDSSPAISGPVFEIGLWPGEGIAVVEALRPTLPLRASPSNEAPITGELRTSIGGKIKYDSTRYQTIASSQLHVRGNAVVRGRSFGPIRFLSNDDYYMGGSSRDTSIVLAPPDVFEFLQHRAEGHCFVRFGSVVVEAHRCPTFEGPFFQVGEPRTQWWLFVRGASASGWLMLTDSTARTTGRQF
jgi:hypothetical protein